MAKKAPSFLMLRLFATSWTIMCAGVAFFLREQYPGSAAWLLLLLAACVFVCGLFYPSAVRPVYTMIEHLLRPVGRGVTFLILAWVYFTLFTAYAKLLRLFGRDVLRLRPRMQGESGWLPRERDSDPYRFYRQF